MKESKHTPGPVIWLNQGESAGEADCGCLLDSDYQESGMPAFIYCPKHAAVGDLIEAAERFEQLITRDSDDLGFHLKMVPAAVEDVRALRTAIARARGGS